MPTVDSETCSTPLRVAVVTETYPPEVNGVAATLAQAVAGLRARGHAVQLVRPRQHAGELPASGPGWAEWLTTGVAIPGYPGLRMGLPAGTVLETLWRQQRPDIVHVVTEGPLGWSALRTARRLGLPVVSDFRTHFDAYSGHYGIGWLRGFVHGYLRWFHNRTACTMVPTERLRSTLAASGFERLRVVSRGVDAGLFDPRRRSDVLRAGWGAGPRTTVALCVGRLAAEKNLGMVVAAVQDMRRHEPGLRLVFVGDGPERARLQHACGDAVFAGTRRGTDLATHYASADVFLFPSLTETFGNVVPEAMASGLAVVAYDHAAAGQLVRHGDNGLLAPFDDAAAFCSMARRLAGDVEQARLLGARARATAERMDWHRIVQDLEAQYTAALATAAPEVPQGTGGRTSHPAPGAAPSPSTEGTLLQPDTSQASVQASTPASVSAAVRASSPGSVPVPFPARVEEAAAVHGTGPATARGLPPERR